jgi:hypothetical protein
MGEDEGVVVVRRARKGFIGCNEGTVEICDLLV